MKRCVWLGVSTSGYYEWVDRPALAAGRRRQRLAALIQAIFDQSDGTYGYRRVHAALARQGDDCGPELVRDIMRELGLVACQPRPWRPVTTQAGEGAEAVADLVGRDFSADAPGQKMVGDITYLPTCEGFSYLATVAEVPIQAGSELDGEASEFGAALARRLATDGAAVLAVDREGSGLKVLADAVPAIEPSSAICPISPR